MKTRTKSTMKMMKMMTLLMMTMKTSTASRSKVPRSLVAAIQEGLLTLLGYV